MNFQRWFDEFWNSNRYSINVNNPTRFHDNLSAKMVFFDSIEAIDDYVVGLKTARESTRRIIVRFYDFLKEKRYVERVDSALYEKRFYDYAFERQLQILKYLHEPRTKAEIIEKFDIDRRTVDSDLQQLEDGIEVLGSTIRVAKEKQGRKYYYKTTVHPIFLPLTLTETYALTVYMDRIVEKNNPNADMIHMISDRIKSQLSDYAFDKLYPDTERPGGGNDYISDKELAYRREGIVMYLMKSGRKCRFFWKDKEYVGRIKPDKAGKYIVVTEDGIRLDAPLSEFDFIVDSLEYE